ncbi:MAG: NAD(P)/FAD-dependent oxidoreductase [Bacteroidales bacterium]
MEDGKSDKSIIIIGAGFAGLAAGIYARLNGYDAQIFELHDKPGGLCTSWDRKGYTIDGCIHWLVGSSPASMIHDFWQEVGVAQGREFVNSDEFMEVEGPEGRKVVFYSNVDRLEKHLIEFSPADTKAIKEFTRGIRICRAFDLPSQNLPLPEKILKQIRLVFTFIWHGAKIKRWLKLTCADFAAKFSDPLLRKAIEEMWLPEFSIFFVLATFAYLTDRNAGYPVGGSLPMSKALEDRFKVLGGKIHYSKRVTKIITDNNRATGISLEDGSEHRASRVISCADGYSTIFRMLGGKYIDDKIRGIYDKWPVFPPLIFIGLGVNRVFNEIPAIVSGISYQLKVPLQIGDRIHERLAVKIFNHDPSMAPAGKTAMITMLETSYDYWKELAGDRKAYLKKKDEIAEKIIEALDQRFQGISSLIEMIDVATPMTFERYTGNWKGSFEGWLITPGNSEVLLKPMEQTLPGLNNFYMCGQWVEPGGGLPTSIMSARRLVKKLCGEDHLKFRTTFV